MIDSYHRAMEQSASFSAAAQQSRAVCSAASPGWDFRVAVCSVGTEEPGSVSDEALMFLLHSAVDQQTVDDIFDEIFRRNHARVARWCCRLTKDKERALDLAQEVFLKAFRHMRSYRGDSRFTTWLYAITRNHCLNSLKKWNTEPIESGEAVPANLPGSSGMEAHIALERNQSFQEMWRFISATLEPMEARVMALHYGHGMPLAAITRQLMLSNPSGAKAYIVNARRKLKLVLNRRGETASASSRSFTAAKQTQMKSSDVAKGELFRTAAA